MSARRVYSLCAALALFAVSSVFATPGPPAIFVSVPDETPPALSFYIHSGDKVVFYGDSITEQRRYAEYVATYCLTRSGARGVRFINSGWGWDTVAGGPGGGIDLRLSRDVVAFTPSVVVICLGANDAGETPFRPDKLAMFATGYRHILDTLSRQLPGVRFTLVSPPAYDDYTRPPKFPGGVNGVLRKYSETVAKLAGEYHATYVDCNTPMAWFLNMASRKSYAIARSVLPDRVHPGPAGHMLIAASILRAWNAPSAVCQVAIDAMSGESTGADQVRDFKRTVHGISFTVEDAILPWPFDRDPVKYPDVDFLLRTTKIEQDFNRDTLQVTGLGPLDYSLIIDGADVGVVSGVDCGNGIDLARIASPMSTTALKVLEKVRYADHIRFECWRKRDMSVARRKELTDIRTQVDQDTFGLVKPIPHSFELRLVEMRRQSARP